MPWSSTHKAFRDHLQNNQWAPNRVSEEVISELKQKRPLRPQSQDHQTFAMKELTEALNKLKKSRAPGPDHNANELFLLLNDDNLDILLLHYNEIWSTGEVPTNWKEAIVVSMYKGKGTDTDPANYRPISLLNTIYKIFASMLQARLAQEHDSPLRDTQFGFRARKGTRHPLFILRRAMAWSEATGSQCITCFWTGNKPLIPLTTTPCL